MNDSAPSVSDIRSLRRILRDSGTIAVVGLSATWHRPSYFAAKYMQEHGYKIIPVNPNYAEILGEKCYASIGEVPHEIDIVDVFQRAEAVAPVADAAIEAGAKVLWMQLGIVHEAAARKAADAGLQVVMDRCVKIEHARLFGGLNFIGVDTAVISSARPRPLP